ncbi:MAG: amidohydrolase family protein [Planctomycetes bacterium]|nr:amidohydrolase family protein [Planctomycetota bacterium]
MNAILDLALTLALFPQDAGHLERSLPATETPKVEVALELPDDRVPKTHTGGDVLIRNATVLTVSKGRLDHASILVRGGKIAEIGRDLKAPDGVVVIDGTDEFVMPGIIDCHSHIAVSGDVNEGGSAISAECRIADVIDPDDISMYRAVAGGVTSANILHGSANPIGGQNAVIKLKYRHPASELLFPGAPRGIKFALGENPKQSNNGGFRQARRFPGTRMGVESALRTAFTRAREYMAEWDTYRSRRDRGESVVEPRRDLRLETLAGILEGKILVHSHCYRADEILMLLRVSDDFGFHVATLQHALEAYKVAPEIAAHGVGVSTFSDWWAFKIEAYDAIPYNAALCTRAGITVSLNSDSAELMRHLYSEAAKTMKYGGLSEDEALATVTLNPAKQLRIDSRVGSIDVGKDADLAIFDGHPLSVYSKVVMTLIDGEPYFERREPTWPEAKPAAPEPIAAVAPSAPRFSRPNGVYAIRNATIVPVSKPTIENGTLVIRDGRIVALGSSVDVPSGAEVIDATGLFVYPGMIDSGSQVGLTEIGSVPGSIDTSDTAPMQPELLTLTAVNPFSAHVPVTRVNGVTSAVTHPDGGQIAGQGTLVRLDGWTPEEMRILSSNALYVNLPSSGPRGGFGRRRFGAAPDEGGAANDRLEKLKQTFRDAVEYARVRDEARRRGVAPPPVDVRKEALLPYARGERPVVISADRKADIVQAIRFAEDLKLKLILSGVQDGWKLAAQIAARKIPCIVGPVLSTPRDEFDPYDSCYANAAYLWRAGVRFAFQTAESSNSRDLPYQAGMAAAYGLPREEALKAVTLYPAQIWGVADQVGSLEEGKVADLFVTDGDPLEMRTQVKHLFIAGKKLDLESRHTELYKKFLERLKPSAGAATASPTAPASAGASSATESGKH